jgi:hypothetical protein
MTNQEQKDKELVEWLGRCVHKWIDKNELFFCIKCGVQTGDKSDYLIPNLSTWDGFGWVWDRMKKGLRVEFICFLDISTDEFSVDNWIEWELKSPRERCNLIWEFKESRKEK